MSSAISYRHIHFNNAGASPSPPEVLDATIEHMKLESEVGAYRAAELAREKVDRVYVSVAQLIGAGCSNTDDSVYNARHEIALTESATVSWTRAFYSMLETKERNIMLSNQHQKEMIILVSEAEYAANVVAAVNFARNHSKLSGIKWRVVGIPSSVVTREGERISTGVIDLESFKSIIDGKVDGIDPGSIAMVCITHIPTNCHIVNPVAAIGTIIDDYNTKEQNQNSTIPSIFYLVDACQSVRQLIVDVKEMKCHALAATGRKYLRGPRGTGFLYVQQNIANALEPSHIDHAAAPVLNVASTLPKNQENFLHLEDENERGILHSYQPGAARFEFWEGSIAARLGLGAAIDLSLTIGMDEIEAMCSKNGAMLRNRLDKIDRVNVYHGESDQTMCGIVTFWCDGLEASIVKGRMQDGNKSEGCCFHLSIVPATSTPLDSSRTGLGMRPLLRASLSYFNTKDEINLFCRALERILCSAD